ncbi:MAG TPA: Arc family DNA-binding protein [Methylosinus sp.]|jgi:plasmid stability protein|uniref:FitA-like ribbon-helix-helix domain-containing protein n=1 Tax=Methylosinus sp. TaxID=427 RepID=UPI002F91D596
MAQLLVRNLPDDVKQKLRRRATEHGRSMEEEARRIIEAAVGGQAAEDYGWASRLSAQFSEFGFSDDEANALELRGAARPAEFE